MKKNILIYASTLFFLFFQNKLFSQNANISKLAFLHGTNDIVHASTKTQTAKSKVYEIRYKDKNNNYKEVLFDEDGHMFFTDDLTHNGDEITFKITDNRFFYGVRKTEGYAYAIASTLDIAKEKLQDSEKREEEMYKKWRGN